MLNRKSLNNVWQQISSAIELDAARYKKTDD